MDGLEHDLAGQAAILRIDFLSGVGRESAQIYSVKMIPTILVFDGQGRLVLRQTGIPDADQIRRAVAVLIGE